MISHRRPRMVYLSHRFRRNPGAVAQSVELRTFNCDADDANVPNRADSRQIAEAEVDEGAPIHQPLPRLLPPEMIAELTATLKFARTIGDAELARVALRELR